MSQYTIIEYGVPFTLIGASQFRYEVDDVYLYLRQTMTGTGFAGTEGVDWATIEQYTDRGHIHTALAIGIWRLGVRDTYWVMDGAITSTAFDGVEGSDWENVEQHKWDQILASSVRITADDTDITADRI